MQQATDVQFQIVENFFQRINRYPVGVNFFPLDSNLILLDTIQKRRQQNALDDQHDL